MKEHLARFTASEDVVFIGKAQEKAPVFRTEKRRNPATGAPYPWIVRSSAMVNHYYCYCLDRDFGPFFLEFCSYFPHNAKLCLNGHEYAKCQMRQLGIGFKALDNGFVSCDDRARLQTVCDQLGPEQIDALLRRWLAELPHPFTPEAGRVSVRSVDLAGRVLPHPDPGPPAQWTHLIRGDHPRESRSGPAGSWCN